MGKADDRVVCAFGSVTAIRADRGDRLDSR
jgi:hypothetical protein